MADDMLLVGCVVLRLAGNFERGVPRVLFSLFLYLPCLVVRTEIT